MGQNLGYDNDVKTVKNITNSSTGWANAVTTLLDKLVTASKNPFGSAARKDTGTASGDVPLIGGGNKLSRDLLPDATENAKGIGEFATLSEHTGGTVTTKFTNPAGVKAAIAKTVQVVPQATESAYGVVKKASSAVAIAGTSNDNMMSAVRVKEVLDAKNGIAVAVGKVNASAGTFTGYGVRTVTKYSGDSAYEIITTNTSARYAQVSTTSSASYIRVRYMPVGNYFRVLSQGNVDFFFVAWA